MSNEVRKWLRPPEKVVEKEQKYDSLEHFFLGDDGAGFMNVYDIEKDESWLNDVFAVAIVNGTKNGKTFIKQDFAGITLAGAKVHGAMLQGSSFKNGNLVAVDFFGSNLENVDFTACDLRKVDFRKCNLKNANFAEANLAGAIFDDADLTGANFVDSYVMGAKLGSAKIDEKTKTEFQKMMQLIEDAQNGTVPLHHLPSHMLKMLDWRRMYLGGVDLSQLDLTGISLVGVNLAGTMQRVVAVPPTYIEKDEKPKLIEDLTIEQNNDEQEQQIEIAPVIEQAVPNQTKVDNQQPVQMPTVKQKIKRKIIVKKRPAPRIAKEIETVPQTNEFIDIFTEEKNKVEKEKTATKKDEKLSKIGIKNKEEKSEPPQTKETKKKKTDTVVDTDDTSNNLDAAATHARLEEMKKRLDKTDNRQKTKNKGNLRT